MLYYRIMAGRHSGCGAITGAVRRAKDHNDGVASPPPIRTTLLKRAPRWFPHTPGPPTYAELGRPPTRGIGPSASDGPLLQVPHSTLPCTPQQSLMISLLLRLRNRSLRGERYPGMVRSMAVRLRLGVKGDRRKRPSPAAANHTIHTDAHAAPGGSGYVYRCGCLRGWRPSYSSTRSVIPDQCQNGWAVDETSHITR